jgi:hypothetical protein
VIDDRLIIIATVAVRARSDISDEKDAAHNVSPSSLCIYYTRSLDRCT